MVRAARCWIGVPFAHQGRSRAGVDCLGLLVMVAEELHLDFDGLRALACDDTAYGHRPDVKKLYAGLSRYLIRTQSTERSVGDIVLMRIDGAAQHLGIISDYPLPANDGLIHAYAPSRKVVEHRLCGEWQNNIAALFRLPQLTQ